MKIKFINSGGLSNTDKKDIIYHFKKIMSDITKKFGERDKRFSVIAFEFKNECPKNYFLNGDVTMILSTETLKDKNFIVWQIAHECIHLLSPETQLVKLPSNYLEEGLATYYQNEYSNKNFGKNFFGINNESTKYDEAQELIIKLFEANKCFINKVRKIQRSISRITKEDLMKIDSNLDTELCEKLCKTF